jgi:hypothetical protein
MENVVAIYEWQAWAGYMLPKLLPEAVRIPAEPRHTPAEVLGACPRALAAFAFHLNCSSTSRFPQRRAELVDILRGRGVSVLNADATEIGKRFLQLACREVGIPSVAATRHGGPDDELVIVKSDWNYGGFGEQRLSAGERAALGVPSVRSPILSPQDYRVMPRREVPDDWWDRPALAVERYVANDAHLQFRIYFAGPRYFVSARIDESPIKKFSPRHPRKDYLIDEETLPLTGYPELPASLLPDSVRLIRHLGIDFGALDVVQDNRGQCYIVDLNTTSYGRALSPEAAEHLRGGLLSRIAPAQRPGAAALRPTASPAHYVEGLLSRVQEIQESLGSRGAEGLRAAPKVTSPAPAQVTPAGDNRVRAAARYERPDDLCVIMCLFNMWGAAEKLRNFLFASSVLNYSGIPLYMVECVEGDQPWVLPPSPTAIRLRAASSLWQKERLINRVIELLPARFTKVAWLDADILFSNPGWASHASRLLDEVAVVQLCERIVRLPRGEHAYSGVGVVWESFASVYQKSPNALLEGNFAAHGHTGFGWAARRDVLESTALYDPCITGGADHLIAHAFCGDWESACLKVMMGTDTAWYNHAVNWAKRMYPLVRARVGVVPGTALHLWHGEIASRQHALRYNALKAAGFDPGHDLRIDANGCWQWACEKPELRRAVAEYLKARSAEAD